MTITDMIRKQVDKTVAFVKSIVDSEENIEELSIEYIDEQNSIPYCSNMILQSVLQSSYGIGVSDILPEGIIESTDKRVIDLQPILKNFDISECDIIGDSGTDVAVVDYIYDKYQIQNWSDFIDEIYKNIRQIIYTATDMGNGKVKYDVDDKTNKMIGTLACTIARYNFNFADIKIGEDGITNIEFDPADLTKLKRDLASILVEKGYIDSSITSVSFHSYQDTDVLTRLLQPVTELNGQWGNLNGEYHYAHIMICLNSDADYSTHWAGMLYFTKVPLDDFDCVITDGIYGALYEPVVKVYNSQHQLEPYNLKDRYIQIPIHNTTIGTNSQPFINTEIGYENWQAKARDLDWNVYIGGQDNRVFNPFYRASVANASSEWILENNLGFMPAPKFITPIIDTTTKTNLEGNDIKLENDNISNWLHIIGDLISWGLGLIPNLNPFDTTHALKIATIDRINRRLLDTHSLVTDFIRTERASYLQLWKNKLIGSDIMPPEFIGLVKQYYLPDREALSDLSHDLWELPFFDSLFNRDPMECIVKFFALPFILEPNKDYIPYDPATSQIVGLAHTPDGQIPIVYGEDIVFKAHGFELAPATRTMVSFDLSPIEINNNFTDYEPYTKASIWLPFIGYRQIDTSLIVNQQLKCVYTIDLATGDFIVRLFASNVVSGSSTIDDLSYTVDTKDEGLDVSGSGDNAKVYDADNTYYYGNPILYESGNMAYPLMLTAQNTNANQILDSVMKGIGNTIMGALACNPVGAIAGAISGVANTAITASQGSAITSKGSIGSGNWMGHCRPYITIYYHQPIDDMKVGTAFDETVGHKSSYGLRIKDMKPGFHKVQAVKLDGLRCTLKEKEMIKEMLMDGFYYGLSKKRVKA